MDYKQVLQDLYDSEINISMYWEWDSGCTIEIGASYNVQDSYNSDDLTKCFSWLINRVIELYPKSEFHKKYYA